MKFTKQQKILGGVVLAGAMALLADRLFILKPAAQSAATPTADYAMPANARSAPTTAPAAPAVSVAQKLRHAAEGRGSLTTHDAFAPGPAWQQAAAETAKADTSSEQFRQAHRLTVVLTSGGKSHAMIDGKIVSVGQMVDGYRLVLIDPRAATFVQGEKSVVLNMAERSSVVAGAGQ